MLQGGRLIVEQREGVVDAHLARFGELDVVAFAERSNGGEEALVFGDRDGVVAVGAVLLHDGGVGAADDGFGFVVGYALGELHCQLIGQEIAAVAFAVDHDGQGVGVGCGGGDIGVECLGRIGGGDLQDGEAALGVDRLDVRPGVGPHRFERRGFVGLIGHRTQRGHHLVERRVERHLLVEILVHIAVVGLGLGRHALLSFEVYGCRHGGCSLRGSLMVAVS